MSDIRLFLELLTPRERRNLVLLFGAVLLMAGLEVVSVASIMPFLSVASNPASVTENEYLRWAFETFGFTDTQAFLIALGLVAFTALVVTNGFIIFVVWLQERFVYNRNHSLSKRLLQRYLERPYAYFLTHNTSDLGKNVLEEAKEVTTQMLRPALIGCARAVVALAIVGFLVVIDPLVALMVAFVLGSAYGGIYLLVRERLDTLGRKRVEANQGRYRSVSEALGGIKEVKLRGNEQLFLSEYARPSRQYARHQALHRVIAKTPRYALEAIAFGGLILITVYFLAVRNELQQVIPMLGLYAFAGYRLMPALQRAFKGFTHVRFNKAALEILHEDLRRMETEERTPPDSTSDTETDRQVSLELREELVVDGVTFTYPEAETPAIRDLSFAIPARSAVGFAGETGSGKTTVVDLILGLLRPQRGQIRVDGTPLRGDTLHPWQRTVGYVPQHIYLMDDTILNNVAFAVPDDGVDVEAVEEALSRAQLHEFVTAELPDGLETVVGERGVKLSGGQRQRIGIARALYRRPSVLVFDEATSALDQATEARVLEAIYDLEDQHTMIMVAHRLSTVRRADKIIVLEEGRKAGEGSYESLRESNAAFMRLTEQPAG